MRLMVLLLLLLLTILCSLYDTPSCSLFPCAKATKVSRSTRSKPTKRHQEDLGYLEQCSILQFWDKQIGRVNVLAFFDSTWPFSHRQAAMLKVLRERFDKTGFENIQFLAINAAPGESDYVSRAEIEVEEETWKQISPSEAVGLPPIVPSAEALASALGPDVYFIQDSAELQIWPKLRAFRDQILVIDRCGRLTYQVIVPWSILHFPYVKAAILSTYKDEPCGQCQFQQLFDYSTVSSDTSDDPSSTSYDDQTEDNYATAASRTLPQESTTTTATDTQRTVEVGNDNTRSDDYYDAQTVSITMATDSSSSAVTLTPPIDANDDETIATTSMNHHNTTTSPLLVITEQTDNIYGDEYSSYAYSRTDNYYDTTTRLPDESSSIASINTVSSIINDYDSTTLYPRDDEDCSSVTDNHYYDDDNSNFTTSRIADFEAVTDAENLVKSAINVTDETEKATDTSTYYSSNGERTRLTDPKEIESLDARDVLKSRSTNARSVSPNDGTDNQLQVIEIKSEAASEAPRDDGDRLEADYLIPIRIIMRAPHVDEYSDRSLKAHEYLVLKTGQPSYHEHLDSEQQPSHKAVHKKSEAVKSTFARDESPGLYGELADYWQNYGNENAAQDESSSSGGSLEDDDDHEHVLEQEHGFADGSATVKPSSTLLSDHAKALESDNEQHYDDHSTSYEDADVIDEEAKSKLIAHYSKLLPWLYYVLAK